MSEAPLRQAIGAELIDDALLAYWGPWQSSEPLQSRQRMAAAVTVVAERIDRLAPEATAAPLTARTLAFAAGELERGVAAALALPAGLSPEPVAARKKRRRSNA